MLVGPYRDRQAEKAFNLSSVSLNGPLVKSRPDFLRFQQDSACVQPLENEEDTTVSIIGLLLPNDGCMDDGVVKPTFIRRPKTLIFLPLKFTVPVLSG